MTVEYIPAASYDRWLATEKGRLIFSRIQHLLFELAVPVANESVLNVECRNGLYLQMFRQSGCALSGTASTRTWLDIARSRLGQTADLRLAEPEDLPFSDNEFDVVSLICVLETANNPQKALAEAIRVSRNRVVVGLLNPCSPAMTRRRLKKIFGFSPSAPLRFLRRSDLEIMIGKAMSRPPISWGSAVFLPDMFYSAFSELEEILPQKNNPLGAFVCVSFPVTYTYRTVQNPLLNVFDVKRRSAPAAAPDAVRGMLRRNEK
ncbi:MAG TPA: class I SAM-dependent methyltransferase [Smithellaceae bacterium]|nr:class I SAM-dependent methyltransferase [Smithellaceae bacterium]